MSRLQPIILPLAAHPEALKTAARWRHEAFLQDDGYSVADSEGQLKELAGDPQGPETAIVAVIAGRLAGICLLVLHELEPAHDLSPWLASLYVDPTFRRQGVARSLVSAIEAHARRNGVTRLHLYTVDAEDFYLKCGWIVAERFNSSPGMLVLMTRDL